MGPLLPMRLLLDGRRVSVREILPEDKEALHAAFSGLSAQSRFTRFMATMRDLSEPMLEAATHPVPDREFALVAVADEGEGEKIVGGARYASTAGHDSCEFAITVVDGWQGVGLAPRLMTTLMEAARSHGFRVMEGFVLAGNQSMRKLAKRLGFNDLADPDDATVRVVRCNLQGGHADATR